MTFVIGHLADEFAVAVFDESAQEKKCDLTAGAVTIRTKRQLALDLLAEHTTRGRRRRGAARPEPRYLRGSIAGPVR